VTGGEVQMITTNQELGEEEMVVCLFGTNSLKGEQRDAEVHC
jgi:hypothetical protein